MNAQTLLIEIGTEELPPLSLNKLRDAFAKSVTTQLKDLGFGFGNTNAYGAPRRLAIVIEALVESSQEKTVEQMGPPLKVAYDDGGAPTKAAEAFAKKCGLPLEQIGKIDTPKGERLYHQSTVPGVALAEALQDIVNKALDTLPIAKRMRWGSSRNEFVRPLRWITTLYGSQTLAIECMGVQSSADTQGHRFHAPGAHAIPSASDYLSFLKANCFVVADGAERQATIIEQVNDQANKISLVARIDSDLLEEVTNLVEWPAALCGSFDASFMQVPHEALVYSMKEHQKYFPVVNKDGVLQPHFIFVANIDSKDQQQVIEGNERVIRPRLADAAFFYETDCKEPSDARAERLKSVVFQAKLGTVYEKSLRVAELGAFIADQLGFDRVKVKRAAYLAKTDLVSNMVLEFDKMQGVAGSYYAKQEGEDADVASAITEQYLPKNAGDTLPETETGIALALAERLDTLVGIFGIGQPPTGSKDPFALRRATIGTLNIVIGKQLQAFELVAILNKAVELQPESVDKQATAQQVLDFCLDRYRAMYQDAKVVTEVWLAVNAALRSSSSHSPLDVDNRVKSVAKFLNDDNAGSLIAANKRVKNILQKNQAAEQGVNAELFVEDAETALFDALKTAEPSVQNAAAEGNYNQALTALAALRSPLDRFFDDVMVMADDEALKNNRIALLRSVYQSFCQIADISELQG